MTGGPAVPVTPETWTRLIMAVADCLTCGAVAPKSGDMSAKIEALRTQLNRWARTHAVDNPGHHAVVESVQGRSYRVEVSS